MLLIFFCSFCYSGNSSNQLSPIRAKNRNRIQKIRIKIASRWLVAGFCHNPHITSLWPVGAEDDCDQSTYLIKLGWNQQHITLSCIFTWQKIHDLGLAAKKSICIDCQKIASHSGSGKCPDCQLENAAVDNLKKSCACDVVCCWHIWRGLCGDDRVESIKLARSWHMIDCAGPWKATL